MGIIKNVEPHSNVEWMSGIYTDNAGQEFEFVFTRTYDLNSRHEEREVVNVEQSCEPIDCDNPVWKEIQKAVNEWDSEDVKFTVEICRELIEALDNLTEQVLVCSPLSPEEAIEASVFSQIKQQRQKSI